MTDNMLDEAVIAGVSETDDLDWKSELPPMKGLTQTDFPKYVAAMAKQLFRHTDDSGRRIDRPHIDRPLPPQP